MIRRGQRSGELRRSVPPLLAGAMLATSYLAIAGEWARHEEAPDLALLARQAFDVIRRGIART